MRSTNFDIFLIFPNFLSSYFLNFGISSGNSYAQQVCYTKYQVPLYLWLTAAVLKYCKLLKYYDQDCIFATIQAH